MRKILELWNVEKKHNKHHMDREPTSRKALFQSC